MNDTKILLNILVLYIPLPVFWALFDQQGSRWTFQATRMTGDLGSYEMKPDQMQVLNPLLILVFIPLYDVVFYPLLSKIGIRRPLQKLTLGGILAGIAFLVSGFVELELEKTYPILPHYGESQLRVFNTLECNYTATTNLPETNDFTIESMNVFENKFVPVKGEYQLYDYVLTSATVSSNCPEMRGQFNLTSGSAISYFVQQGKMVQFEDDPNKSRTGDPLLRVLSNTRRLQRVRVVDIKHRNRLARIDSFTNETKLVQVVPSSYNIILDDTQLSGEFSVLQGSVSTVLVRETGNNEYTFSLVTITDPNSLHMFWLIPQYVIMTLGEVMYSVTGLAFSYAQAPESMKAVLQACWLLTVAFGNVIDIIVVGAKAFESQVNYFIPNF